MLSIAVNGSPQYRALARWFSGLGETGVLGAMSELLQEPGAPTLDTFLASHPHPQVHNLQGSGASDPVWGPGPRNSFSKNSRLVVGEGRAYFVDLGPESSG